MKIECKGECAKRNGDKPVTRDAWVTDKMVLGKKFGYQIKQCPCCGYEEKI